MSHDAQIVSALGNGSSLPVGRNPHPVPLPDYRERGLSIRPATLDDLAFIDGLQKKHTNMVGWMPTKQLEGKIQLGHVIVAEEENAGVRVGVRVRVRPDEEGAVASDPNPNPNPNPNRPLHASPAARTPVGYCIGHDQYFKRDDVGIIYQLNVVPDRRRSLVGATLVKAMFDRAAYGCRLFCCWCAQDIEANHFWESLGFVPLAFREIGRAHV